MLLIFLVVALAPCAFAKRPPVAGVHFSSASPYHYEIKNFTVNLDHFSFANNHTFPIR